MTVQASIDRRHGVAYTAVAAFEPEFPGKSARVVTIDGADYFTADEVCAILAVKPATLYAYVSRGRLRSYRQGMRRQRLYRRDEVEQLAQISPAHDLELPDAEIWAELH